MVNLAHTTNGSCESTIVRVPFMVQSLLHQVIHKNIDTYLYRMQKMRMSWVVAKQVDYSLCKLDGTM